MQKYLKTIEKQWKMETFMKDIILVEYLTYSQKAYLYNFSK
jgi:hypothetical protein